MKKNIAGKMSFYLIIAISLYHNIACKNPSSDEGLNLLFKASSTRETKTHVIRKTRVFSRKNTVFSENAQFFLAKLQFFLSKYFQASRAEKKHRYQ
jgi:hypothetical protein